MSAYYNEHDTKAAAWLRELIKEGHIAPGEVDERSILDVKPHEISGYTQQHFFAGIGGWSLALRLAGWPDDRPVRTGSCPCQPFSQAGKGLAEKDERHLWPVFRDIITFGEPTITFGEQVASKAGREWLAGVRADLEGLGYEVGAADLCAAGVAAPHPRQRIFWMGFTPCRRDGLEKVNSGSHEGEAQGWQRGVGGSMPPGRLVQPNSNGREAGHTSAAASRYGGATNSTGSWAESRVIECRDGKSRRVPTEPSLFPVVDGLPYRMARNRTLLPALLKGAGNAIVPQVAAEFIHACLDSLNP